MQITLINENSFSKQRFYGWIVFNASTAKSFESEKEIEDFIHYITEKILINACIDKDINYNCVSNEECFNDCESYETWIDAIESATFDLKENFKLTNEF